MLKQTTSNKRVQFKGTPTKEAFMKDLRGRVNKYFEEKGVSQYANGEMWFKTVFAVAAWAGAYWLLMSVFL